MIRKHPIGLLVLSLLCLFGHYANAQVYNRFGPADGVLVGDPTTYQTTAAAASDIISLWTGTCNASSFLRGDGSCQIVNVSPAGSDTQVQFNSAGAFAGATSLAISGSPNPTVLVGDNATARNAAGAAVTSRLTMEGIGGSTANLANLNIVQNSSSTAGLGAQFGLNFGRTRGTAYGALDLVANNDIITTLRFSGSNGSTFVPAAQIIAAVDGTASGTSMPGRIVFLTTPDGTNIVTERLRISNTGAFGFGGANYGTAGQVLTSNGSTGVPTWQAAPGGSPGGSDTYVQFNNSGAFGGDAGLTYNAGTDTLTAGNLAVTTAATVGGQNVCLANGTNCPAAGGTSLPIRSISTTDNTQSTDCGKAIVFTGAGSQTFTLDADPAVNCVLTFINNGSASVSLAASGTLTWFNGSGTNNTGTRTIMVGGVVTATVLSSAGSWQIWGAGISF